MDIHITFGWWIAPALITAVSFAFAAWTMRNEHPSHGDYSGIGNAMLGLVVLAVYSIAAIVSLGAWLIWSLA